MCLYSLFRFLRLISQPFFAACQRVGIRLSLRLAACAFCMQEDVVVAAGAEGRVGVAIIDGVVGHFLHDAEIVAEVEVVHGAKCRGVLVVLRPGLPASSGILPRVGCE